MLGTRSFDLVNRTFDYDKNNKFPKLKGSVGADLHGLEQDRAIKTDPDETRRRRTIRLSRNKGQSWGFTLQTYGIRNKRTQSVEIMSYVDYVEIDGSAWIAGMQRGDIILSVNGESVESCTHGELVRKIQSCGRELRLVALFEDCCQKVELHERYLRLKKLLYQKVKELRGLEEQERRINQGLPLSRLDVFRQSNYSSNSNDWDVYSEITSPSVFDSVPANRFAFCNQSFSDFSIASSSNSTDNLSSDISCVRPNSEEGGTDISCVRANSEEGGTDISCVRANSEEGGTDINCFRAKCEEGGTDISCVRAKCEEGGTDISCFRAKCEEGGTDISCFRAKCEEGGTDISCFRAKCEEGGTDISCVRANSEEGGTDISCVRANSEEGGTDISCFRPKSEEGGTDISCFRPKSEEEGTDISCFRPKSEEGGTDISCFRPKSEEGGTDISCFRPKSEEGTDMFLKPNNEDKLHLSSPTPNNQEVLDISSPTPNNQEVLDISSPQSKLCSTNNSESVISNLGNQENSSFPTLSLGEDNRLVMSSFVEGEDNIRSNLVKGEDKIRSRLGEGEDKIRSRLEMMDGNSIQSGAECIRMDNYVSDEAKEMAKNQRGLLYWLEQMDNDKDEDQGTFTGTGTGNIKEEGTGNIKEEGTGNIKEEGTYNIKEEGTDNIKEEGTDNIKEEGTDIIKEEGIYNIKEEGTDLNQMTDSDEKDYPHSIDCESVHAKSQPALFLDQSTKCLTTNSCLDSHHLSRNHCLLSEDEDSAKLVPMADLATKEINASQKKGALSTRQAVVEVVNSTRRGVVEVVNSTRQGVADVVHSTRRGVVDVVHSTRRGVMEVVHSTRQGVVNVVHSTRRGVMEVVNSTRRGEVEVVNSSDSDASVSPDNSYLEPSCASSVEITELRGDQARLTCEPPDRSLGQSSVMELSVEQIRLTPVRSLGESSVMELSVEQARLSPVRSLGESPVMELSVEQAKLTPDKSLGESSAEQARLTPDRSLGESSVMELREEQARLSPNRSVGESDVACVTDRSQEKASNDPNHLLDAVLCGADKDGVVDIDDSHTYQDFLLFFSDDGQHVVHKSQETKDASCTIPSNLTAPPPFLNSSYVSTPTSTHQTRPEDWNNKKILINGVLVNDRSHSTRL